MTFWVAGAIVVGGAASAAIGGNASKSASNAQQQAADAATAEQRRQYDLTRVDYEPWRTAGVGALNRLTAESNNFDSAAYLAANPDVAAAGMDAYEHYTKYGRAEGRAAPTGTNLTASPDYQFRRNEGTRDIGSSFAARGGSTGGNALKALAEFNSNLASGEYSAWWNRQAGLAGVGQQATDATAQAGTNSANQISQNYLASGDARASGIMGSANSLSGSINSGINNWLLYKGGYFGNNNSSGKVYSGSGNGSWQ